DEEYAAHNVEVTPGEYVAVSITDSGSGMPAAVVERVFEPFFTTKAVGHGTRITVYLPRAYAAEQGAAPAAPAVRADLAGHKAILVVEDSNAVRRVAVN